MIIHSWRELPAREHKQNLECVEVSDIKNLPTLLHELICLAKPHSKKP